MWVSIPTTVLLVFLAAQDITGETEPFLLSTSVLPADIQGRNKDEKPPISLEYKPIKPSYLSSGSNVAQIVPPGQPWPASAAGYENFSQLSPSSTKYEVDNDIPVLQSAPTPPSPDMMNLDISNPNTNPVEALETVLAPKLSNIQITNQQQTITASINIIPPPNSNMDFVKKIQLAVRQAVSKLVPYANTSLKIAITKSSNGSIINIKAYLTITIPSSIKKVVPSLPPSNVPEIDLKKSTSGLAQSLQTILLKELLQGGYKANSESIQNFSLSFSVLPPEGATKDYVRLYVLGPLQTVLKSIAPRASITSVSVNTQESNKKILRQTVKLNVQIKPPVKFNVNENVVEVPEVNLNVPTANIVSTVISTLEDQVKKIATVNPTQAKTVSIPFKITPPAGITQLQIQEMYITPLSKVLYQLDPTEKIFKVSEKILPDGNIIIIIYMNVPANATSKNGQVETQVVPLVPQISTVTSTITETSTQPASIHRPSQFENVVEVPEVNLNVPGINIINTVVSTLQDQLRKVAAINPTQTKTLSIPFKVSPPAGTNQQQIQEMYITPLAQVLSNLGPTDRILEISEKTLPNGDFIFVIYVDVPASTTTNPSTNGQVTQTSTITSTIIDTTSQPSISKNNQNAIIQGEEDEFPDDETPENTKIVTKPSQFENVVEVPQINLNKPGTNAVNTVISTLQDQLNKIAAVNPSEAKTVSIPFKISPPVGTTQQQIQDKYIKPLSKVLLTLDPNGKILRVSKQTLPNGDIILVIYMDVPAKITPIPSNNDEGEENIVPLVPQTSTATTISESSTESSININNRNSIPEEEEDEIPNDETSEITEPKSKPTQRENLVEVPEVDLNKPGTKILQTVVSTLQEQIKKIGSVNPTQPKTVSIPFKISPPSGTTQMQIQDKYVEPIAQVLSKMDPSGKILKIAEKTLPNGDLIIVTYVNVPAKVTPNPSNNGQGQTVVPHVSTTTTKINEATTQSGISINDRFAFPDEEDEIPTEVPNQISSETIASTTKPSQNENIVPTNAVETPTVDLSQRESSLDTIEKILNDELSPLSNPSDDGQPKILAIPFKMKPVPGTTLQQVEDNVVGPIGKVLTTLEPTGNVLTSQTKPLPDGEVESVVYFNIPSVKKSKTYQDISKELQVPSSTTIQPINIASTQVSVTSPNVQEPVTTQESVSSTTTQESTPASVVQEIVTPTTSQQPIISPVTQQILGSTVIPVVSPVTNSPEIKPQENSVETTPIDLSHPNFDMLKNGIEERLDNALKTNPSKNGKPQTIGFPFLVPKDQAKNIPVMAQAIATLLKGLVPSGKAVPAILPKVLPNGDVEFTINYEIPATTKPVEKIGKPSSKNINEGISTSPIDVKNPNLDGLQNEIKKKIKEAIDSNTQSKDIEIPFVISKNLKSPFFEIALKNLLKVMLPGEVSPKPHYKDLPNGDVQMIFNYKVPETTTSVNGNNPESREAVAPTTIVPITTIEPRTTIVPQTTPQNEIQSKKAPLTTPIVIKSTDMEDLKNKIKATVDKIDNGQNKEVGIPFIISKNMKSPFFEIALKNLLKVLVPGEVSSKPYYQNLPNGDVAMVFDYKKPENKTPVVEEPVSTTVTPQTSILPVTVSQKEEEPKNPETSRIVPVTQPTPNEVQPNAILTEPIEMRNSNFGEIPNEILKRVDRINNIQPEVVGIPFVLNKDHDTYFFKLSLQKIVETMLPGVLPETQTKQLPNGKVQYIVYYKKPAITKPTEVISEPSVTKKTQEPRIVTTRRPIVGSITELPQIVINPTSNEIQPKTILSEPIHVKDPNYGDMPEKILKRIDEMSNVQPEVVGIPFVINEDNDSYFFKYGLKTIVKNLVPGEVLPETQTKQLPNGQVQYIVYYKKPASTTPTQVISEQTEPPVTKRTQEPRIVTTRRPIVEPVTEPPQIEGKNTVIMPATSLEPFNFGTIINDVQKKVDETIKKNKGQSEIVGLPFTMPKGNISYMLQVALMKTLETILPGEVLPNTQTRVLPDGGTELVVYYKLPTANTNKPVEVIEPAEAVEDVNLDEPGVTVEGEVAKALTKAISTISSNPENLNKPAQIKLNTYAPLDNSLSQNQQLIDAVSSELKKMEPTAKISSRVNQNPGRDDPDGVIEIVLPSLGSSQTAQNLKNAVRLPTIDINIPELKLIDNIKILLKQGLKSGAQLNNGNQLFDMKFRLNPFDTKGSMAEVLKALKEADPSGQVVSYRIATGEDGLEYLDVLYLIAKLRAQQPEIVYESVVNIDTRDPMNSLLEKVITEVGAAEDEVKGAKKEQLVDLPLDFKFTNSRGLSDAAVSGVVSQTLPYIKSYIGQILPDGKILSVNTLDVPNSDDTIVKIMVRTPYEPDNTIVIEEQTPRRVVTTPKPKRKSIFGIFGR